MGEETVRELLPCPFCGCKEDLEIIDCPGGGVTCGVSCPCGAEILGMFRPDESINQWNTRTPPPNQ